MSQFTSAPSYGGRRTSNAGSTNSSFQDRDEARQKLEQTQRQWSRTRDQLSELVRARSTTPHMSPVEIDTKDRQILDLQFRLSSVEQQMVEYQRQLKSAETTIMQQQATIRNQSKAIENPRAVRDGPLTPVYQRHSYQQNGPRQDYTGTPTNMRYNGNQVAMPSMEPAYGNTTYGNDAPVFSPSHHNFGGGFDYQQGNGTPRPVSRNTFQTVNDFGSPEQIGDGAPGRPLYPPRPGQDAAMALTHGVGSKPTQPAQSYLPPSRQAVYNQSAATAQPSQQLQSPQSTVSSNPYPESSIPSSQTTSFGSGSSTSNEAEIRESFQKLFDMTVQYAKVHVNFPSTAGDNALPQSTKDRLMKATTASSAFGLMSNGGTRYLLISKIMISWMIKHLFKHNTFSGLDTTIDQVLDATKATIYQSTPPHIRFLLLNNMSIEIQKIRSKPNFGDFDKYLAEQRAHQLWVFIRPLMHQQTTDDWEDLLVLMHEAHRLLGLVYTGTDEYGIEFPDVGQGFNRYTMLVNHGGVDPACRGYSVERLRGLGACVRLGVTPVVSVRRNAAQGTVTSGVVLKAVVLLKIGRG